MEFLEFRNYRIRAGSEKKKKLDFPNKNKNLVSQQHLAGGMHTGTQSSVVLMALLRGHPSVKQGMRAKIWIFFALLVKKQMPTTRELPSFIIKFFWLFKKVLLCR